MTDKFLTSIGVNPVPTLDLTNLDVPPTNLENDFEESRANLIRVMHVTKRAIESISLLAEQTQDPEAFSSLNGLIRSYGQQQSQLLQLYKLKTTEKTIQTETTGPITNQNLFVGSTAELAGILDKMKK
jgi:hypothetical protein